jgi:hypothetical protein
MTFAGSNAVMSANIPSRIKPRSRRPTRAAGAPALDQKIELRCLGREKHAEKNTDEQGFKHRETYFVDWDPGAYRFRICRRRGNGFGPRSGKQRREVGAG